MLMVLSSILLCTNLVQWRNKTTFTFYGMSNERELRLHFLYMINIMVIILRNEFSDQILEKTVCISFCANALVQKTYIHQFSLQLWVNSWTNCKVRLRLQRVFSIPIGKLTTTT